MYVKLPHNLGSNTELLRVLSPTRHVNENTHQETHTAEMLTNLATAPAARWGLADWRVAHTESGVASTWDLEDMPTITRERKTTIDSRRGGWKKYKCDSGDEAEGRTIGAKRRLILQRRRRPAAER